MCVGFVGSVLVVVMALGQVPTPASSLVGQGCFLQPVPTTNKNNNSKNTVNYKAEEWA